MKLFRKFSRGYVGIVYPLLLMILISITGYAYASELPSLSYNESQDTTSPLPIVSTGSQVYYPSGTYYFTETDLRIPARSIPMVWERTYRSNRIPRKDNNWVFGEPADGPLGFGWSTPFSIRIEGDAYVNEAGRYFYFTKDANGNYLPNMEAGFVLLKSVSGYELMERGGNTRIFDIGGRLTSIRDPRGNTATLTYDSSGRLTSINDVMNRQIFTFTYNSGGRIASITDLANRTITYEYDPIGNLIKVSHEGQVISSYTYNSNHGLTTKSNALGETYTVEYYPIWADKGVAKRIIDPIGTEMIKAGQQPAGHETTFTYDFKNRVFYYTDYRGATYKNVTNEKGQIVSTDEITDGQLVPVTKSEYLENRTIKTTDALGNVTITQKDEWGNVIKRVDAEGYEWRYTYDTKSKLLSVTDPLGTITRYEYDSYGNRTKETVAANTTDESITTYTYNQYNELLSMTKGSAATYYTFSDAGSTTAIRDVLGNTVTMTYDAAGNLLSTTQPLIGATTYAEYDYRGNPGKVTDPNGNSRTYGYDLLGRIKTMTEQSGGAATTYNYVTTSGTCSSCGSGGSTGKIASIILPEGNRTVYSYNNVGVLTTITDNDGNTINYTNDARGNRIKEEIKDTAGVIQKTASYQYDQLNRLLKAIKTDGSYTLYRYDGRGNRNSAKDPNGNITLYTYDSLNRLKMTTQPGNVNTSYTYDKRGNLTGVTDANGNATTYGYDKQDRLTKTISPDTNITTYTYDLNGNLKTKTDAGGVTITYEYDSLNRITKIDFPTDTDIVYTYDTCLNGKGRVCSMNDVSGETSYEYTAKGQVAKETKVIDGVTYVTEYGYDKNGNMKTMKYPSGRMITYNYSNDKVSDILNNAAAIASNISYKPFGGMSSITNGNGIVGNIGYDNQYRIRSITTGNVQSLAYTHDFNGNITGITNALDPLKNKAYTYDVLDRLTGATGPWGTLSYSYDGVGNRQTETNNASESNYSYAANRLMIVAGQKDMAFAYDNNGNTVTESQQLNADRSFVYNQNQRLIKVTENGTTKGEYTYNGNGQRVKKTTAAGTTVFHYDLNGQIMSETTISGGSLSEYMFLNGNPFAKIESGSVYYYHTDHLGTSQTMTDLSSAVVWEGEFLQFGEPFSITGTVVNNLRFPGQYYDEKTGLSYNYFRDYNPAIGRYVESDPVGIERGKNHLYGYVGNNSVNLIDPLGLSAIGFPGNGNVFPGYSPQKPGCDKPAPQCLNKYPKMRECCNTHDDCYARYLCNYSSWLGGNPLFAGPCQLCNLKVVWCLMNAEPTDYGR